MAEDNSEDRLRHNLRCDQGTEDAMTDPKDVATQKPSVPQLAQDRAEHVGIIVGPDPLFLVGFLQCPIL
jgi:hypothetical protein